MTDDEDRLRESIVTDCLDALDWSGLEAHLEKFTLNESAGAKLVELIMRARAMVFRYPGKTKKRAAILDGVVAKICGDLGDEAANLARDRFALFALIEEGYAALRSIIDALPLAPLPKEVSFSAYLAFVARDWSALQDQIKVAWAEPRTSASLILTAPDHDRVRGLITGLTDPNGESETKDAIRGLIEKIVAVPVPAAGKRSRLELTLHGDLAGILALSLGAERMLGHQKTPCEQEVVESVGFLVAGVGFEPTTFRL